MLVIWPWQYRARWMELAKTVPVDEWWQAVMFWPYSEALRLHMPRIARLPILVISFPFAAVVLAVMLPFCIRELWRSV